MEEMQQLSDPEEIVRLVNEQIDAERARLAELTVNKGSDSNQDCLFTGKLVMDALRENEDGDARLYIELHRDRFVFDTADNRWYKWGGHFWIEDSLNDAMRGIDDVIGVYLNELDCISLESRKELSSEC